MKKIVIFSLIFSLIVVPTISYGIDPISIAYHSAPGSPVIEPAGEVAQITGQGQTAKNQAVQMQTRVKADITSLQLAMTAAFSGDAIFAILSASGSPGQDEATLCGQKIDKVSNKQLMKKMKKGLMTYKSSRFADIEKVNQFRTKFYLDNIYSIHTAAEIILQDLNNEIADKGVLARECYVDNERDKCDSNSQTNGGNNETIYAYTKAIESLNNVVRLWESVAALKARLAAIKALRLLDPVVTKDNNAKNSANKQVSLNNRAEAVLKESQSLAFAQVVYKQNTATSLSSVEATIKGNNSQASRLIDSKLSFAAPAPAENIHPLTAAKDKIESFNDLTAVENQVSVAMEVHNTLGELKNFKQIAEQYNEMKKEHEKLFQKLQESEQCAIKYLGNYFSNPITAWSGVNLGKNLNRHDLRKGISGWAIDAFETAKAAETSSINVDDIAIASFSDDEVAELSDDADFSKSQKYAENSDTEFMSKSKEEQSAEENRKSNMISWQIGAEASKILGENPANWGNPSGKKMVWTDTKNFYQQYLRRKYENIKAYLKVYTRNDVLAMVVAKLKGDKQDINDTKYQKQLQEAKAQIAQKINANSQNTLAAQQQFDAQSQAVLSNLQKRRDALVAKMDGFSKNIKDNKNNIADMRDLADSQASQQIDEKINAKIVLSESTTATANTIVGVDKLEKAVAEKKASAIDEKKIAAAEKQIKADKNKLEKLQKQLDDLDDEIANTKLAAQEKSSGTLTSSAAKIASIQDELAESIKLNDENYAGDVRKNIMAILSASAIANPLLNPATMLVMVEKAADVSLTNLYKQVDAIIDGGYQQMLALGDNLYVPESQSRLVQIHNQMINQIKTLMLAYSVAGLINVNDIAVYAKLATADISPETEGLFVGSSAKARDLRAPHAIPNFNLPPVREVFHFDDTDFASIKPKVKGKKNEGRSLTASEFLNFGGDIPIIWQHMLKDNAFIESRFNLKEALNYGCSDVAFSRGGIMPCVVKNSSIVLDVNAKGEYLHRTDIKASNLPNCLLIEMKKGKPHHTLWDADVVYAKAPVSLLGKKLAPEVQAPQNCAYSELGMLLDADENNNLKFKTRAFSAYNELLDDSDAEKLSKQDKNKKASAYQASLIRNQIGDFLKHAENEKTSQENLDEYKQKYDDQMKQLTELLSRHGFTPSKSFDLSKSSDYNLAVNKIKSIKNKKISEATSLLSKVDIKDNPPAEEKAGRLNKLISIMKKDTDGVLKVSPTSADVADLEGQLKKAKADGAVVDKYKNSLKEQANNYNDSEQPYCANY